VIAFCIVWKTLVDDGDIMKIEPIDSILDPMNIRIMAILGGGTVPKVLT
jgi:hypothetical protein